MLALLLGVAALATLSAACTPSVTTVSGTFAPSTICSGQLIFSDEFNEFDLEKWQHESTLAGGCHWEFQYYDNNRTNSFAQDGVLFLRPSLTSNQFSEAFLSSSTLNIDGGAPADSCTNPKYDGCERKGTPKKILNPIKSARIRTVNSFSFRYGRFEARAKMPAGDWLWPAIWLIPTYNAYGTWPSSGEIDLVESRGNRNLTFNGHHIGAQRVASSLVYAPFGGISGHHQNSYAMTNTSGFNNDFHRYQLEWTPDFIKFSIDDVELSQVDPGKGGFWEYGGFGKGRNILNPWRYGSKMAPYDQKFFIIMNVAVGGNKGTFPDGAVNPYPRPWKNGGDGRKAATDFWNGRKDWLPTWKLTENDGHDASMQVDYVRVWAL